MPAPRRMTKSKRVAYNIAADSELSGYECGYTAHIEGCSFNDNPMAKGSGDWLAWQSGWREAGSYDR